MMRLRGWCWSLAFRWRTWRERSREVYCGKAEHWWQRDHPFGPAP